MSRAYTADEMRAMLLGYVRNMVIYWDRLPAADPIEPELPPKTQRDRLDGLAFSILAALDGDGALPFSCDLIADCHEDDEAFNKAEGENWVPRGTVINKDAMMHEEWSAP